MSDWARITTLRAAASGPKPASSATAQGANINTAPAKANLFIAAPCANRR